ncbi:MAG: NYN domain-containing protein [Promethearchaeota archaeon]
MNVKELNLKAALFIDHSNLAHPILNKKAYRNYAINYRTFKEIIFQEYTEQSSFIFMGVNEPLSTEKEKFMKYLENVGFLIMTRPVTERENGTFEQKQVDILMHEIMVSHASEVDVIIIVSGDVDFSLAANIIINMGKIVVVWSWKESLSVQLRETVSDYNVFYIDDIWDKIKVKRKSNTHTLHH